MFTVLKNTSSHCAVVLDQTLSTCRNNNAITDSVQTGGLELFSTTRNKGHLAMNYEGFAIAVVHSNQSKHEVFSIHMSSVKRLIVNRRFCSFCLIFCITTSIRNRTCNGWFPDYKVVRFPICISETTAVCIVMQITHNALCLSPVVNENCVFTVACSRLGRI